MTRLLTLKRSAILAAERLYHRHLCRPCARGDHWVPLARDRHHHIARRREPSLAGVLERVL